MLPGPQSWDWERTRLGGVGLFIWKHEAGWKLVTGRFLRVSISRVFEIIQKGYGEGGMKDRASLQGPSQGPRTANTTFRTEQAEWLLSRVPATSIPALSRRFMPWESREPMAYKQELSQQLGAASRAGHEWAWEHPIHVSHSSSWSGRRWRPRQPTAGYADGFPSQSSGSLANKCWLLKEWAIGREQDGRPPFPPFAAL